MVRNYYEDLKSRGFLIDVVEGLIIIVVGFVLLLGEFLQPSIPLSFYAVKGPIDFSFGFSLFAGIIVLLPSLSFVLVDSSVGR